MLSYLPFLRLRFVRFQIFLITVFLVQFSYAQDLEVLDIAPNPSRIVSDAINVCYQNIPLMTSETATEQERIYILLVLDKFGMLANAPLSVESGYSGTQRRLFRKAMLAIDRCTPVRFDDLAPPGEYLLTVSQDSVVTEALTADLIPAKELNTLPQDYLALTKQEPKRSTATEDTQADLKLSQDARREIQQRLKLLDKDPGSADGVFGPKTRTAISQWQTSQGFPPSGYLSDIQLDVLKSQSELRYQEFKKSKPKKKPRRVRVCKRGVLGVLYDCRYVWR